MTQAKLNKNPDRRQISNLDGTIDGNIFIDTLPLGTTCTVFPTTTTDGDGINGV